MQAVNFFFVNALLFASLIAVVGVPVLYVITNLIYTNKFIFSLSILHFDKINYATLFFNALLDCFLNVYIV